MVSSSANPPFHLKAVHHAAVHHAAVYHAAVYHARVGQRADELNALLIDNDYLPIHVPLFKIVAGHDTTQLITEFASLPSQFKFYIFTSVFAVEYVNAVAPQFISNCQNVIAIGDATALALHQSNGVIALQPEQHNSEGVIQLLNRLNINKAVLFKGEGGRSQLETSFKLANKVLKTYNVYKRDDLSLSPADVNKIISADIFIFTSGEIGQNLIQHPQLAKKIKQSLCLTPSNRVNLILAAQGCKNIITINSAKNRDVIKALNRINRRD